MELDEKPAEGVSAKVLRSESRVYARVTVNSGAEETHFDKLSAPPSAGLHAVYKKPPSVDEGFVSFYFAEDFTITRVIITPSFPVASIYNPQTNNEIQPD